MYHSLLSVTLKHFNELIKLFSYKRFFNSLEFFLHTVNYVDITVTTNQLKFTMTCLIFEKALMQTKRKVWRDQLCHIYCIVFFITPQLECESFYYKHILNDKAMAVNYTITDTVRNI